MSIQIFFPFFNWIFLLLLLFCNFLVLLFAIEFYMYSGYWLLIMAIIYPKNRSIFCKCFHPFCRLPLHCTDSFLCYAETFKNSSTYLFFLLLPSRLVSNPEGHCQELCQEAYHLCFLIEFCNFRSEIYVSNPF